MAQDLVRVRLNGVEKNVGRAYAKKNKLEVLDEPVRNADGTFRSDSRPGGRPAKPKTSVAKKAAEKKEQAAVIEPAPTDEEQNR